MKIDDIAANGRKRKDGRRRERKQRFWSKLVIVFLFVLWCYASAIAMYALTFLPSLI